MDIIAITRQPEPRSAPKKRAKTDDGREKEYPEAEANSRKLTEEQKKAAGDFLKKQQAVREKREREQEKSMLEKELENSDKEAEAVGDSIETFTKCMKIAARIAKGDIVPPKDIKYLADHEPDLYKQAIIMRVPNDKPKKHKSLVEDEDERSDSTREGSAADSTSSESADAAEAGDAAAAESAPADTGAEE